MPDDEFQSNWLDRMSQCIAAAADTTQNTAPSKEEMQADFKPTEGEISEEAWCGELKDLFSPDDKNPDSRRFIELIDGQLSVSAGRHWRQGPPLTDNFGVARHR